MKEEEEARPAAIGIFDCVEIIKNSCLILILNNFQAII
jgi:hypothetical protein